MSADAITDADPVTEFGYLQDFDGTWLHSPQAPENWLVVDVGGSGTFTWVRYTNTGTWVSYPASVRGYGSGTCNDFLISPPLALPDTALRLSWWDKVSNASYPNSYKILVSTTNNLYSSFTNEIGDYTCTNTEWQQHIIDLNAFKGQTIYIAFYQYDSQSQYYTFTIDNILVETLIPGSASLITPDDGLTTFTNPDLKWDAPASAQAISGYKVYLDNSPNPTTLVYQGSELYYQPQGLAYNTTYYWKVVPYNAYGEAYNVPVWSFKTVTSSQLAQSFEAPYFPPVSWETPSGGWFINTSNAIHGFQSTYRYSYPSLRPKLVTPLLEVESGDKLEFYEGTSEKINNFMVVCYSWDKIS